MKNIIEIAPSFPCEVFINRHVASLNQQSYPVQVLARHASRKQAEKASVHEKLDFKITPKMFPNLAHLSSVDIGIILKQLISVKRNSVSKSLIRDRVYFEFIKRLKPDLIHFHFGNLAGAMYWIPQELGIPYTLSLRGSDIQVVPLTSIENTKLIQEGLNHAAGIHTVSDNLWDLARPYLRHDVFHKTIYTTVPVIGSVPTRKQHYDEFCFVTTGRLHWRKNYVDLLKAFRRLLDTGLKAKLLLIGDGTEKECLLYWVSILDLQGDVTIAGKLDQDQIREILASSTGYIQSSIAEGFSNATAEAMALGLPVFATEVGGTGEIIKDGFNGFLLDPLKPNEWHKKLLNVNNTQLIERIGVNAWQTSKEIFSESIHARAFIDFYDHVLNNPIN